MDTTHLLYAESSDSKNHQLVTVLKLIITGLIVSTVGIWVPLILLILVPGVGGIISWVVFLMIFLLYTSWHLFNFPDRDRRAAMFRRISLTRAELFYGLLLALVFVLVGQSFLMVTFRLIPYPREQFLANTNYEGLSSLTVWIAILISAMGAGIYEEIGFRGYMQQPLETRHGFLLANIITSLVFTLFHLNQAYALFILPQLFVMSIMLGVIAYLTQSLIPGIFAHTVLDIFNFGYWWYNTLGSYNHKTVWETSLDVHFIVWLVLFIFSVLFFILLSKYLYAQNNHETAK